MHGAAARYCSEPGCVREREQLLRKGIPAGVLGEQLPSSGGNKKEVRSGRAVLRPQRSWIGAVERGRLHEAVNQEASHNEHQVRDFDSTNLRTVAYRRGAYSQVRRSRGSAWLRQL